MIKESTRSIYNCLTVSFWTARKCLSCQKFFTLTDLANQNYQLFFKEVIKIEQYNLEVMVELTHQQCSLFKTNPNAQIEIVKDIICK
jgi:hypothetical protein